MDAPEGRHADEIVVDYVTHRETSEPSDSPSSDHSGLYRDPLPLANGAILAVHTSETRADENIGSRERPRSRYDFRIRAVVDRGDGTFVAGPPLTDGIEKSLRYWDPDVLVEYSGFLWELQPVEVRARPRPVRRTTPLPHIENQLFAETGVDSSELSRWMRTKGLALIVSRNVTSRDDLDRQQPFNLRVRNGGVESGSGEGRVYEVAYLQLFQADQIRGLLNRRGEPRAGRRVLAQLMHDGEAVAANGPVASDAPPASVEIAPDGSVAAFVPARRALSWQITDGGGTGVVRERYWVTFQPGEVRVCASCHGLSDRDQMGRAAPQNPPEALRRLLLDWKAGQVGVGDPVLYLPDVRGE